MGGVDVSTGLEEFLRNPPARVRGQRIGLITNHSAVDRRLDHAVDLIRQAPGVTLAALFGPEHGVRGVAQAGEGVASETDARTGLPVYSLYGKTRQPTPAMLHGLDALVYDIQDVGVRYATYLSTLLAAMRAAATAGLAFVVLDRPNPLDGVTVQGSVLKAGHESFVGAYPLAIRHGLTLGEVAVMANERDALGLDLTVVPMAGWRRDLWYDETALPWIPPTPNLPTLQGLTLYPGTCLIEGTNLSEGRGTTVPFEVVGAPWLDAAALVARLRAQQIPGVHFRATSFAPTFSKHSGRVCHGVQIHVTERAGLDAPALGVYLLAALRELHPHDLAWAAGDSDGDGYVLDRLAGTSRLRTVLDAGATAQGIVEEWQSQASTFAATRTPYLLYDG